MTGITFVWLLTKYPIDELVHPSAKTMAVKIPQSTFLNTLLTVSLLLLSLMLSMGVLFGGIWRHLSTSSPNSLLYLLASNVFIGIPLLILGGFLLLPQKQIVSFVSKTWLQRFSFKRSKYDFLFLRIIGVMLVCFGCIFIYGLSINRHSNSILFVTQSTLNPSIVNATPTYSIHLEPTWTMTP